MLKIKDNVDLKELEKYGFEYDFKLNYYVKRINYQFYYREIVVFINNPNFKVRELKVYSSVIQDNPNEKWLESNIQDLIKANLVEKVE